MPMGISVAVRQRAMLSTSSRKAAPNRQDMGISLRQSLPTMRRLRCGITSPTQPIIPDTDTAAAVSTVDERITARRSRSVCTPMARASSGDRVSRFIRHRSRSRGTSPTAMQTAANRTVPIRVPDRLPMSQ